MKAATPEPLTLSLSEAAKVLGIAIISLGSSMTLDPDDREGRWSRRRRATCPERRYCAALQRVRTLEIRRCRRSEMGLAEPARRKRAKKMALPSSTSTR